MAERRQRIERRGNRRLDDGRWFGIQNITTPPDSAGHGPVGSSRGDSGEAAARPDDVSSRPLSGLRILVVEDEALIAMEMQAILDDLGAEPIGVASTAADAVAKAEALRPDLLTMDVRLAGQGDGIEAAVTIWRNLGIRSLFVSAYSEPSILARAEEAEPLGWVAKPFTTRTIARALSGIAR